MSLHPDLERVALLGWHLVPTTRRSRKGYWRGYFNDATCDLDMLERWQYEFPGCNWAVLPGPSGVWALDVDIAGPDHVHNGVASLRALCAAHGPLPPRPHGRSGGGGHLLVFRSTAAIAAGSNRPAPGLDCQANRSATFTISPSRHRRTGDAYRWVVAPWEAAPPAAPEWLLAMLAPPPPPPKPRKLTSGRALAVLDRTLCDLARAEPGGRNAALNRAAYIGGKFAGAGLVEEGDAIAALYSAGRHIGLDDAECRKTIRSGWQAGLRSPVTLH